MTGAQPPAIPMFYPGLPAVPQLNAMSQAFAFLLDPPTFRARRAATGTATKNAHTKIPWDTIDEDPYTGWAAGNPTRYTVQAPGWYLVTATASLSGTGASGTVMVPAIEVNGNSPTGLGVGFEGPAFAVPTSAPMVVSGVWEVYANLNDYIELDLWYSSEPASNLTWTTTSGQQSRIEIVWMGI